MVREAPAVFPEVLSWWPPDWLHRFPLLFPAYDALGVLRSIHARALAVEGDRKSTWPLRCRSSALILADTVGLEFLRFCARGHQPNGLEAIVIAEGATDTLKLAQVLEGNASTIGVLGYESGSKNAIRGIHWPAGVPCIVATDDDATGDRYASEIRRALDWTVNVFRVKPPLGRDHTGSKLGDWSDLPDSEVLAALTNPARWEVCHG